MQTLFKTAHENHCTASSRRIGSRWTPSGPWKRKFACEGAFHTSHPLPSPRLMTIHLQRRPRLSQWVAAARCSLVQSAALCGMVLWMVDATLLMGVDAYPTYRSMCPGLWGNVQACQLAIGWAWSLMSQWARTTGRSRVCSTFRAQRGMEAWCDRATWQWGIFHPWTTLISLMMSFSSGHVKY